MTFNACLPNGKEWTTEMSSTDVPQVPCLMNAKTIKAGTKLIAEVDKRLEVETAKMKKTHSVAAAKAKAKSKAKEIDEAKAKANAKNAK